MGPSLSLVIATFGVSHVMVGDRKGDARDSQMQDDQTPITDRIQAALADKHRSTTLEDAVWASLPGKTRERLGRTRLRQIIATELESDQLELAIDGERFTANEVAPEFLIRRAEQLRARAAGLIRRAEDLEAAAQRRREA